MAFRELEYQARALSALDDFLKRLGEERANADKVAAVIAANPGLEIPLPDFPAKAWERMATDKGVPGGRVYSPRVSGDGQPVPNITLKVPTGGGKTYLACAALSRIFGRYAASNRGMVLWIVPNEAIYTQTLRALRNRDHAYRQTLDRAAAGRVVILEKGDTLNRADADANLCVMVLMLQSSNRENQDSLRLFRDRGDVHGFVPGDGEQAAHKALLDAVPNLSIYDLGNGTAAWPMIKTSMGNAMRIVRPVVVMDEGQRAVSDLAFRTLYDFNPRFVLELSATPADVAARAATATRAAMPARRANILVDITGRELEREGMIKMPMHVAPLPGTEWQSTLRKAWERLDSLELEARSYQGEGGRYIRPILLVQVERTGAEQTDAGFIHAQDAREWLKSIGLDDEEIALKTSEINDLDKPENVDLMSPNCRVRAVITRAALAEGWDCPFAYVLCALAANGNESAMTQLVGRILRQPHATKTGVDALDECYVFAHRADTAATVAAIKRGLENDGLGDLARDVMLTGGPAGQATARKVHRRDDWRTSDIALPQVLTVEGAERVRPFDAETDLFPLIDWTMCDLNALAARLPKNAAIEDSQTIMLRTGESSGVVTVSSATVLNEVGFDSAYAVRAIGDVVPNGFAAWALVDEFLARLRGRGWTNALIGRLGTFLIDQLRKELIAERERQAPALFRAALESGGIQFAVRGDAHDWQMPDELWTTHGDDAAQLTAAGGGPLERSLFLPIYSADLNDSERKFAVYLDRDAAVRWWHRNGTMRGSYGLRGWRRGNVYPDFLFAALTEEGQPKRIVVVETKGEQLEGNRDTEYKRALLKTLSGAFGAPSLSGEKLALERDPFDFNAAVVLFDEIDARLPALIHGVTDRTQNS